MTELPRLARHDHAHELQVDGQPFLLLGAQVHNSSGSGPDLERAWDQLRQLHANTLEVPIYWSELEPEEGRLDFSQVDEVLAGARAHGVRLVLLWFATWKNGAMDYAPGWVKADPERFPRMLDRAGDPVRVLSPHSRSNLEADRRAFVALMSHLRDKDEQRTVIMVQVQNEPGSLFVDRDHCEAAEALFAANVPAELTSALGRPRGSWAQAFGSVASDAFSAYFVARYVDQIARAGKEVLDLPMSVNAWLLERKSWQRPGEQYPSGGPTSGLLDVWKAAAPSIDVLAPDIYVRDYVGFRQACASYRRDDNPLLVPETFAGSAGARYAFYAVGEFGAIGYAPFGFNRRDGATELREDHRELAKSFRLLANAAPVLLRLRREAAPLSVQVAVEEEQLASHLLRFDGWDALVQFGPVRRAYGGEFADGTPGRTGRALVMQVEADGFLLAGVDAAVQFRPADRELTGQLLRVERGSLEGDEWRAEDVLNGDQTFFGLRLGSRGSVLRVALIAGAGGGRHP